MLGDVPGGRMLGGWLGVEGGISSLDAPGPFKANQLNRISAFCASAMENTKQSGRVSVAGQDLGSIGVDVALM